MSPIELLEKYCQKTRCRRESSQRAARQALMLLAPHLTREERQALRVGREHYVTCGEGPEELDAARDKIAARLERAANASAYPPPLSCPIER